MTDDEIIEVSVRCDNILEDVISLYSSNPHLALHKLSVSFVGEEGDDFGGFTKDLFTSFWIAAFKEFFYGEDVVVPSLPLHRSKTDLPKFIMIGRILSHSVALTGSFPVQLCMLSIMSSVFGENTFDESDVIENFLLFVTPVERSLLQVALSDFASLAADEQERQCDLFQAHGLFDVHRAVCFREHLCTLAEDIFCRLCDTMHKGVPDLHFAVFWSGLTLPYLKCLYESQRPNGQRLANCLVTDSEAILTRDQETALYRLRLYVQSLQQEGLETFLFFFTTASIHMPPDGLKITFNGLTCEL